MKQKNQDFLDKDEVDILSDQLDSREMFILGFLKGFNRTNTREWTENGLWDFSEEAI
jgi:hypothetical protein